MTDSLVLRDPLHGCPPPPNIHRPPWVDGIGRCKFEASSPAGEWDSGLGLSGARLRRNRSVGRGGDGWFTEVVDSGFFPGSDRRGVKKESKNIKRELLVYDSGCGTPFWCFKESSGTTRSHVTAQAQVDEHARNALTPPPGSRPLWNERGRRHDTI